MPRTSVLHVTLLQACRSHIIAAIVVVVEPQAQETHSNRMAKCLEMTKGKSENKNSSRPSEGLMFLCVRQGVQLA